MIAPNRVVLTTDPQRSVVEALLSRVAKKGPRGASKVERGEDAAEDAEDQRVDVEQPGHDHQREEAGDDEVFDRVDAEYLERVELLTDLARAQIGGDRGAADAGEDDRGHKRRELPDAGEHEEPAEAVDRPEQHQEVARLQPRCAVAERDRRDRQREPAQPQREQKLLHELRPIRIRRTHSREQRLAREDHHVPHLLQQVLRRQKRSVCDSSDHYETVIAQLVCWSTGTVDIVSI